LIGLGVSAAVSWWAVVMAEWAWAWWLSCATHDRWQTVWWYIVKGFTILQVVAFLFFAGCIVGCHIVKGYAKVSPDVPPDDNGISPTDVALRESQ